MAMDLMHEFNPMMYDPTQSVGNLPVGRHKVIIESSTIKETNTKSGALQLILRVVEGQNQGATGQDTLNLYHSNPQTVDIAHRRLSAYAHVCGISYAFKSTSVLHNIPFLVDVTPQTDPEAAKKGYTSISKIMFADGREPGRTPGGQQQPQQGPQGGFGGQQFPQQQQAPATAWGAPQGNSAAAPGPAPCQAPPQQQQAPQQSPWGQQPPQQQQPQQPQQQNAPWGQQQPPAQAPAPAAGGWQGAPAGQGANPPWGAPR